MFTELLAISESSGISSFSVHHIQLYAFSCCTCFLRDFPAETNVWHPQRKITSGKMMNTPGHSEFKLSNVLNNNLLKKRLNKLKMKLLSRSIYNLLPHSHPPKAKYDIIRLAFCDGILTITAFTFSCMRNQTVLQIQCSVFSL